MQRLEVEEGELVSGGHMVLAYAAEGKTVWYCLTEIYDTREAAYKLAKIERKRLIAMRAPVSDNC